MGRYGTRGPDRGRRKKRNYRAEFWRREDGIRKRYLERVDFTSERFKGTPIMRDWRKYGQLASECGCLRVIELHDFKYLQMGDGRSSKYLTKRCRELSRKAGVESFIWYRLIGYRRKHGSNERPAVEIDGYYFKKEILKQARLDEIATAEVRRKAAGRKARQRERGRLARLTTQRPLIEEILTVLNAIKPIKETQETELNIHELICLEDFMIGDRETGDKKDFKAGDVWEIDTKQAHLVLDKWGTAFRRGFLTIKTKNKDLQRNIDYCMHSVRDGNEI